nr:immunoglobulin light chain junction region [Macaca mulatta]
CMQTLEFPWSF